MRTCHFKSWNIQTHCIFYIEIRTFIPFYYIIIIYIRFGKLLNAEVWSTTHHHNRSDKNARCQETPSFFSFCFYFMICYLFIELFAPLLALNLKYCLWLIYNEYRRIFSWHLLKLHQDQMYCFMMINRQECSRQFCGAGRDYFPCLTSTSLSWLMGENVICL